MKKNDRVIVPIGTVIKFFSGSVLEKDCIKTGKMEYEGRGKLISNPNKEKPQKHWVAIGLDGSEHVINADLRKLRHE